MKRLVQFIIIIASAASCQRSISPESVLWYDSPAQAWEETLPLGNGRLGMMPYGGVHDENILLNEISLWSGSEADYANPDAAASLEEIRSLLMEGKNAQAQDVMYERFVPHKPTGGGTYGSYEVLGQICMSYHHEADSATLYKRGLDLKTATAWTEFTIDGARHTRRYYASRPADIAVIEAEADSKGSISFDKIGRAHV